MTTTQQSALIEAPKTVDPTLVKILSWKRPYNTKGEIAFMAWLHDEIKSLGAEYRIGPGGNVIVQIKRPDGKASAVLFSCHTDTVHSKDGDAQSVVYDPAFGHIFLDKKHPDAGSCLGADDGAGVWLMLRMIKEKKPGTYIFHRGEERGGIGAHAMLKEQKDWLQDFDLAIAFDRPGTHEVITHQGGLRCASDKLGAALVKALNEHGEFSYETSTRGVFTDTKVYRNVISECINIGVGYFNQHGPDETLDYQHLCNLLDAVLDIDFDALPVDRDPTKADVYSPPSWQSPLPFQRSTPARSNFGVYDLDDQLDDPADDFNKRFPPQKPKATPATTVELSLIDELEDMTTDELYKFVEQDSISAAETLMELMAELRATEARVRTYRNLLGLPS